MSDTRCLYWKIWSKNYKDCCKHKLHYNLGSTYNEVSDATMLTHQIIQQKYPTNLELINHSKSKL